MEMTDLFQRFAKTDIVSNMQKLYKLMTVVTMSGSVVAKFGTNQSELKIRAHFFFFRAWTPTMREGCLNLL